MAEPTDERETPAQVIYGALSDHGYVTMARVERVLSLLRKAGYEIVRTSDGATV